MRAGKKSGAPCYCSCCCCLLLHLPAPLLGEAVVVAMVVMVVGEPGGHMGHGNKSIAAVFLLLHRAIKQPAAAVAAAAATTRATTPLQKAAHTPNRAATL